ncbi:hypothetical protein BV898_11035 [Hypsibius exemplaris]|uniref:Uncharacterized protein n=1 Tax=Hypsibius exemplaris TaxID=2072580 RepID=A0A1W0WHW5_HYPEX|nr:hypothetical protein BV898_11035 [Hypsibius exemplaris]
MATAGGERGTMESKTFATAEVLTPSPTDGEGKTVVDGAGGRVTKVTTTHYTTKTVTTRMAIGNEREITAVMASNGLNSHVPPLSVLQHIDDGDHQGTITSSGGGARKVSFPTDALVVAATRSSDAGTANTSGTPLFSGRLLKYGYRLFGNSWHPINIVISRDGVVEWTNTDDHDHSHLVKLKELLPGMIVAGRAVLEIPTYLSPKLNKGMNADHIVAVGKNRNGKVKSYWFAAESDEEFARLKAALGQIVGYPTINLEGSEVRKIWTGEGEVGKKTTATASGGGVADGTHVTHHETVTVVRDSTDHDGNGDVQTPRRKAKSAKEAFFEAK